MALDNFKNDCVVRVSTGYAAGVTTIVLAAGEAAKLPAAPFNAKWYNKSKYPNSYNDPLREYIRVTAVNVGTDTLTTIVRAQESTADNNHNIAGDEYWLIVGPTAFTFNSLSGTSTVDFGKLTLGGANQRGGILEVKEATAASLTAGYAHGIISYAATTGVGFSILNTGFSTDVEDGITFHQNASGVSTLGVAQGSLLTSIYGISQQFYPSGTIAFWYGTPGTNCSIHLGMESVGGNVRIGMFAKLGTHPLQGPNYFNPAIVGHLLDGIGGTASAGELGWEGNWTNAGGFTERRVYLWDHDITIPTLLGRTLFYWQKSTETQFKIGGDGIALNLFVEKGGYQASGGILTADNPILYGNQTWNNGAVAFNALKIDVTNTASAAGSRLMDLQVASTTVNSVSNKGRFFIRGLDAQETFTNHLGTSVNSNFFIENKITDTAYTSPINNFYSQLFSDFASDPGTKNANGAFIVSATAVNATSLATFTVRALNPVAQHNGTGTLGNAIANQGTIQNNNSGAVTLAASMQANFTNGNASGVVTEYFGFRLGNISNSGTVTNTYGFWCGDITAGTQTNKPYAFYNADTQDSRNFFGSAAFNGFGTATPLSKLHIEGSNGWILQDEQDTNPTTTELDANDCVAIYNKANTLVFAFNNAGTMTYLKIALDGSTTTWTQNTTAP